MVALHLELASNIDRGANNSFFFVIGVGFSFITAHGKELFGKKEATLKDCDLNPEAAEQTKLFVAPCLAFHEFHLFGRRSLQ